VVGFSGCGGGPIVEQDETLEAGGIAYRVLGARAVPGTEPTVVAVTVRATNVTRERRRMYGAERSPVVFVVLSGGKKIETSGAPERGVLGPGETITFTLRAETGTTQDLALQLLSSTRYPLSGNEGRIELRDL
jgi:hypothetical protein